MKRIIRYIVLGIWLFASTKFTYDSNQEDPTLVGGWGLAITASVLAFNLPIWIIIFLRDIIVRRREIIEDAQSPINLPVSKAKRIRTAVVWIVVIALGYQVVQENSSQTASLSESPQIAIGKSTTQSGGKVKKYVADTNKNLSEAETPGLYEKIVPGSEEPFLSWSLVGEKSGNPLTWKTCKAIKIFLNTGGSSYAEEDVQFVINYLNTLGSLNFVYAGMNEKGLITDGYTNDYKIQITYGERESFPDDWNNAKAVAVGGASSINNLLTSGQIAAYLPVMDEAKQTLRRGVLLHEFGHVLGLNHTTTPGDIMYPSTSDDEVPEFNQDIVDYFANNPGCVK
jgi:hypothetical protein